MNNRIIDFFKLVFVLYISTVLAACQVTMNGIALKKERLQTAKKITVVAIAGDTLSLNQQRLVASKSVAMDIQDWGLDDLYGQRFNAEISKSLGVQSELYTGPHRNVLKDIYDDHATLIANRFAWKKVEGVVKQIAHETRAQLVVLILRDEFQDELAQFKYLVRGYGLSAGQGRCAAFAKLTLVVLDGANAEPIAGSNVYVPEKLQRTFLPINFCRGSMNYSADQVEHLKNVFHQIIDDATIEQTVKRLKQP